MINLDIIHTNDFHNHLSPDLAGHLVNLKLRYPNALLLDAGDAVSAGNVGVRVGGEPILREMSRIGYDAMTMGNREFHFVDHLLRMKIADADFPILCCNMQWKDDKGDTLPVVPHIIRSVDGIRIGIIGATVPMVTSRMAARAISAHLFDDPVRSIQDEFQTVSPQCDIVIALTHIGLREDVRLAEVCPGLTAIIGGHSHAVLEAPRRVNGVPIFQGGWYGHYVGHIIITGEPGSFSVDGSLEKMSN